MDQVATEVKQLFEAASMAASKKRGPGHVELEAPRLDGGSSPVKARVNAYVEECTKAAKAAASAAILRTAMKMVAEDLAEGRLCRANFKKAAGISENFKLEVTTVEKNSNGEKCGSVFFTGKKIATDDAADFIVNAKRILNACGCGYHFDGTANVAYQRRLERERQRMEENALLESGVADAQRQANEAFVAGDFERALEYAKLAGALEAKIRK